jgi:integrase/recombinase XerD
MLRITTSGATLYGRVRIKGRLVVWSLHTSDTKVAAERRKAGKDRMIADVHHGDARRDFVEVLDLWAAWITKQVGPKTVQRYACSLDQMRSWLDGKGLRDVDSRAVAEIIRARSAAGMTNATVKRDLVALSSVLNYAIDQGWRDDNPVLPRMREKFVQSARRCERLSKPPPSATRPPLRSVQSMS